MNTIGTLLRCTTWGESHGVSIGAVLDGCPAGLEIQHTDIEKELERDIPDIALGIPRREPNDFRILSGVYNGITVGTPICIEIPNRQQRSSDYDGIKHCYRPGHAEHTYHKRYGVYNSTGGRASGRVSISFLAAGVFSKKLLSGVGIGFESKLEELAGIRCRNGKDLDEARKKCMEIGGNGDSTGGIVSLKIMGVPAGVGTPVFGKLNSLIMYALSSIGGVKGVECGMGFEAARMTGLEHNDGYLTDGSGIKLESNNCGGTLGGISTGTDLYFRLAVKPTPSIQLPQKSVDWMKEQQEEIKLNGRFDINFAPRVGPLAEALASLVLADQMMISGYISPSKASGGSKGGI
ncbi:chorismate synthase [Anaerobacterium chartisolvens]|uniref:Chorismate synthase n=1 Tax=Anaerobacterium chartisolvens TaxID=1297424 RepID=A0A369BF63_9FIRM|nr:chorismate synthase [Anaerobacterium chartisolvens]RCX20179.1 chorismate synthase [Anaerobacterium chartisolvens]